MPGVWQNLAQEIPGSGTEFILVPYFEDFPLVVLSTTPLMEASLVNPRESEAPDGVGVE